MRLGVSSCARLCASLLAAALVISAPTSGSVAAVDAAPAQPSPKLDSQLRSFLAGRRPANIGLRGGNIEVVVAAASGESRAAAAAVRHAGGFVHSRYGSLVEASLAPSALSAVAADRSVSFVRPPLVPIPDAVGEGAAVVNAPEWHARGLDGSGVKIAVIDSSFKDHQALGLGVVDLVDGADCDTTSSHGTAVAQVVREIAPRADLRLYCVQDEGDLLEAERAATDAGVKIIVHSMSWFNGGRGDGVAATNLPDGTAAEARSKGILWVNSAGNFAPRHWSGTFSDPDNDGWHNFSGGDEGNGFSLPPEAEVCAFLKWDDWGPVPLQPSSTQDFNLYLFRVDARFPGPEDHVLEPAWLTPVAGSANAAGTAPTEQLCYRSPSSTEERFYVAIQRAAATASPRFDLFITRSVLEYQTPEGSVAEPATSPKVLAVGAVCWQGDALVDYSSRGPTIDGRMKPDLVGPESVSSPFAEFGPFTGCGISGFRGSSAATPHVGAAAALVAQAHPLWTADQIQGYLEQNARDLGPPGKDNLVGSGRVWLPSFGSPPASAPPPPPSPPPPARPPKLQLVAFSTVPARSRAGRPFVARAVVAVADTGTRLERATLACAATLARKRLPPVAQRFRDGVARCVWALPRSAGRKRLRGSLVVRYQGARLQRAFEQRVLAAGRTPRRAPRSG